MRNDGRLSAEEFLLSTSLHPGNVLTCPKCGDPTDIKDSRPRDIYGFATKVRRRACVSCDHRFNTVEVNMADYVDIRLALDMLLSKMEQNLINSRRA